MFSRLTDFGYTRSPQQALGFYLAYFLLLVICAGFLGGLTSLFTSSEEELIQLSAKVGIFTVSVASLGLSCAILHQKKLWHNYFYILLAALAGALSLLGGAVLGLIPVAYLTTRSAKKQKAIKR